MSSTFRSAMGKSVDMSAIRTRNENVRAIGNMNCNARGDIIDNNNTVVTPVTQRVTRVYSKTTVNSNVKPKPDNKPVAEVVIPVAPVTQPIIEPESLFIQDEFLDDELEFEMSEEIIIPKEPTKSKKK